MMSSSAQALKAVGGGKVGILGKTRDCQDRQQKESAKLWPEKGICGIGQSQGDIAAKGEG